jgi:hypothetical protein
VVGCGQQDANERKEMKVAGKVGVYMQVSQVMGLRGIGFAALARLISIIHRPPELPCVLPAVSRI